MQKHIENLFTSHVITTADRSHAVALVNLKSALEALCSQGEEVLISKCMLTIEALNPVTLATESGFVSSIILLVSDAAIATAADQNTKDLDTLLNAMTAGDFEFKVLSPPKLSRAGISGGNTTNITVVCRHTVDITRECKKASKLIYNPVLATNPEIQLVSVIDKKAGTQNVFISSSLQIEYMVRTKTARML